MEKRISYYVSRKNVLTWLSVILMTASVASRIAFFCGEKGADAATVWPQLMMPAAACLWYVLIVLLSGKEHLYRTALPAALIFAYYAIRMSDYMGGQWFTVIAWVAMLAVLVLYNLTFCGRIRHNWLLLLVGAVICGTLIFENRKYVLSLRPLSELRVLADLAMSFGMLVLMLAMQVHLDGRYHSTWGDRPDGRRVRSVAPITFIAPYIMPNRNGASNSIQSRFEITELEKYIHEKRKEGMTNFGITHVFLAAYVRCVAQYPGLNRFLAGQHIYSRGEDIQFCMVIKKEMSTDAPDTIIKLHLNPADTINTIYEKFDEAATKVKNTPLDSNFDKTAHALTLIPGVLLKFTVWLLKTLDYFGLLPGFLLEVSPFHGSVFFTSMGSLGIPPITHHLYDFGNLPAFCAFGRKYRVNELNADGTVGAKKYIDYIFNLDERTVDGFYYATVLKMFERLLRHPEKLETPPETVLHDIP